ncbi:hypothetical protein GON03_19055 [Nocardioides sp. MAH-18]|uniref:Uncharacterized protein n=1 Tax=Nocardioides agri TaxID=2682843 RepID=A0A6L6Y148_9ACTN|nr:MULTISPECIES: hypothetical protein [unclassified Nocardioides]MBA2952116.1 hypothetical protein [Nocardioides sp. CGMCC 1.13656]MVQ51285.1 hypothetical protein [Nocardioides sp. MAH-18]
MAVLTDVDKVRVLINDYRPDDPGNVVFTTTEIQTFLDLEGGSIKRAAAQACDMIADNEALVSKVIRTQTGLSTDGPKVAAALRERAASLREQAVTDDDADGHFEVVDFTGIC